MTGVDAIQHLRTPETISVQPRGDRQVLEGIAELLVENLAALKHLTARMADANTAPREGGASSISFEDMTKGEPKTTTKHYAGSPLTREDVDAALLIHAYAHRRAAETALNGWQETITALSDGSRTPDAWKEIKRA